MSRLAVIPARYASSRFPAKPLALLRGKEMVLWVYDAVKASGLFDKVLIATDDLRIESVARAKGADVMMTSENLSCGTERCEAVLSALEAEGKHYDVLVNVQGDEPLIEKAQLESLISLFDNPECRIATLAKRIERLQEAKDPNCVKVVMAGSRALYFSRSVVPYPRGKREEEYLECCNFFKHIGIYGFKSEVLHELVRLPMSQLELTESLEQLRWLENGYPISVAETEFESLGVDTPEDLRRINEILEQNKDIR